MEMPAQESIHSLTGTAYYSNFTGEPDVLVGYKEMLFNIAEGIESGWVTGNAETFYKIRHY